MMPSPRVLRPSPALVLAALPALCVPGRAQAPAPFAQVGPDASPIDFDHVVVAVNCGTATYRARGVIFHGWNASELDILCDRSPSNLTDPFWNGGWPDPFLDRDLDELDAIYRSIGYWNQTIWIAFKDLNPEGRYTLQVLFTAHATATWDHGGSLKVIGREETDVFHNVHLNTFANGVPYVVAVEDIQPSLDGRIRVEYLREPDWVCSPACDANKIWSGLILSGPPIAFPTDLAATKEGDAIRLTWTNHEPSADGTPYDEIEVRVDGALRATLAGGDATIDEAADNRFAFDLADPANADLGEGAHIFRIRTRLGGYTSTRSTVFGIAPIRIAVGDYGPDFEGLDTSDGRVWTSDALIVSGDRIPADWEGNVDPVDGVAGIEALGLDPFDPFDRSLFARFRWDSRGGRENHMKATLPVPNGSYDVRLYFWEYASPWIYDRTAEVAVEGGRPTYVAYADEEGIYAPRPNEGWMLLLESVGVEDGVLDIDLLPGWGPNGDVTLSAIEVLDADPSPKGPRHFAASTTGDGTYRLSWEIPEDADYDRTNILSRMSGQAETIEDPAATSLTFQQEIPYASTANEAFVLGARAGNTFYAQLHAGAGVGPVRINAGGAGEVNDPSTAVFETATVTARDLTWFSDLAYVDPRHDFVAPLVSGDRNFVSWDAQAFQVLPGSPAEDLDPPFETPEALGGGELALLQRIRWTWTPPYRDPALAMRWEIPVDAGAYDVRLTFGEGCCLRATDVAVEGSEPERIYYNGLAPGDDPPGDRDYVPATMGEVALLAFEGIAVADGFLTIAFDPFTSYGEPYDSNPTISAIEVIEAGGPPPVVFLRGDVDGNAALTIGDGIQILERLFVGRAAFASECDDAGDTDDNGVFTIGDAVRLFNYLFGGGPAPQPPGPSACGEDPTPQTSLGPCDYPVVNCP